MFFFLADEMPLIELGSKFIKDMTDALNTNCAPWIQEWRRLARHLKIPFNVYQRFDMSANVRNTSPTKQVLQWLLERSPRMTLINFTELLEKIECKHAIQVILEHIPDTVGMYDNY